MVSLAIGALSLAVARFAAGEPRRVTALSEAQVGVGGFEELVTDGRFDHGSLWLGAEAGAYVPASSSWWIRVTAGVSTFARSDASGGDLVDHYNLNEFGGYEAVYYSGDRSDHVRVTQFLLRVQPVVELGALVRLRFGAGVGLSLASFSGGTCPNESARSFAYTVALGSDVLLGVASHWHLGGTLEALSSPVMRCGGEFPPRPPEVRRIVRVDEDEHMLVLRLGLGYSF